MRIIAPVDFETLLTPLTSISQRPDALVELDADLAQQHRCRRQTVLNEMAKTQITLTPAGLYLIAPNRNRWEPDDAASQGFAQMPAAFARDYLQLRLRNFLYETFCSADKIAQPGDTNASPVLTNDRLGGGLHVGLLEQFQQSNRGTGFFDPGWTVLRAEADGTVAVKKDGIVVHVGKSALQMSDRTVSVKLPGHRFESEMYSSAYVAIGNGGPVPDCMQAVELYLAAFPVAMPSVMTLVTTALNGEQAVPYTLKVPYRPEDYEGPEAIALRIPKSSFTQVLPLIEQIWQQHLADRNSGDQNLADRSSAKAETYSGERSPWLRPDLPVFAEALWPGISAADVIASTATRWFGSSADLSRIEQIAIGLVQQFYPSS